MSAPEQLGDFRIEEEIGRGGFGVVYLARQLGLDRPVALKVLYEHKVHTADEIARFEREARAAARLDHPALVSVYAWGEERGSFFIAQKLVGRGRTVADELAELKRSGDPPKGYYRQVAERIAQVAEGLQHAHERGIVHRDIKPSNILLDDQGRPFLGDFGLAKIEDGLQLSRTGDLAGSPFYMSPEQADARRGGVDHRSDIYGLGVTLYELLTLQPPFTGDSSHEIIRKILMEEPRPPRRISDRVPADLETICLAAMEKSRVRRYQSADALAHDLRCFLDGEPIAASPPSTVSRILRKAQRHRHAVGMVVLALALLGVAVFAEYRIKQEAATAGQQAAVSERLAQAERAQAQDASPFDGALQKALEQDDVQLAREARQRQQEWESLLAEGSDLIRGLLPEIQDSQAIAELGRSLEEQWPIVEGVKAVRSYLEQKAVQGSQPDPRLAQLEQWLAIASRSITAGQSFLQAPENPGTSLMDVPGVSNWLEAATGFLSGLDTSELGLVAPDEAEVPPSRDLSSPLAPLPPLGAPPLGPPTSPDGAVPTRRAELPAGTAPPADSARSSRGGRPVSPDRSSPHLRLVRLFERLRGW